MPKGINSTSVNVFCDGKGAAGNWRIDRDGDVWFDLGRYPHTVRVCMDRESLSELARVCEQALCEMEARRQESLNVAPVDASAAKLPETDDDELLITE